MKKVKTVFIDGSAGTTGLLINERLRVREDIRLITLTEEKRKDRESRREALNSCDIAFLCLPDAAAIEAVGLVENKNVTVIDASSAHRTDERFAYGFPELGEEFSRGIKTKNRVCVPGCHASGFLALVHPLLREGVIAKDALLCCNSLTGYSGGGRAMIAEYESGVLPEGHLSPRVYGLGQSHKHLPEMQKVAGLTTPVVFTPVVANFYSGLLVTVPIHKKTLNNCSADDIKEIYSARYSGRIVNYDKTLGSDGFIPANACAGLDCMRVGVCGNGDRIVLTALYDNLGKGASGAAVQCMNILLGKNEEEGLRL